MTHREKNICAFFDVDNTVLDIKSMFSFMDFYISRTHSIPESKKDRTREAFYSSLELQGKDNDHRKEVNRKYYELFSGISREETISAAEEWFSYIQDRLAENLYIRPVLERMNRLRESGIEVVFVSGSFHELLHPVMKDLNVRECVSTVLEVKNGKFTGRIEGKQIIGEGKSDSVKEYANSRNIDLELCYAFGDHISDLEMLSIVGFPAVIEGDPGLERIAAERSWEVIKKKTVCRQES